MAEHVLGPRRVMSDFARQQADFQRGILAGDDKRARRNPRQPDKEKRETLFGVYRYAYGSRLVEALRNDHELLHAYLGDEMFDEMGHAYVKARPSHHPNLRWFSQGLPEFLQRQRALQRLSRAGATSPRWKSRSTMPLTAPTARC